MFVGQRKLWTLLDVLIPKMREGENINLIFRAPSGFGKTKMAIMVALKVTDEQNIQYELPDSSGEVSIDESKRIIILDEVHELKSPEVIYPLMDSKRHCIFLCSNETGNLKEPLVNRCIPFIFDNYEMTEIQAMVDFLLPNLPVDYVITIADNCQLNPRVTRKICQTLGYIFEKQFPQSVDELKSIIVNTLQIENGLNLEQRRYLDFLCKVNRASLDLISSAIRIDRKTIQRDIEPYLIQLGKISITSRGRICLV